jgi:hypothetical protein
MTDQTLGWGTDERIAALRDEAERRRMADRARARRTGARPRITRYLETRLGRRPDPIATAGA